MTVDVSCRPYFPIRTIDTTRSHKARHDHAVLPCIKHSNIHKSTSRPSNCRGRETDSCEQRQAVSCEKSTNAGHEAHQLQFQKQSRLGTSYPSFAPRWTQLAQGHKIDCMRKTVHTDETERPPFHRPAPVEAGYVFRDALARFPRRLDGFRRNKKDG